jgi:arsenate reductase-like glutaredoxin family protein
MFQKDYDKPTYIYGTYDDCMTWENNIEKDMRNRIETYLDKIRVTPVKKSDLKSIYDGLKDLEQSAINNKNKTKKEIAKDLRMFLYKFAELAKIK